MTSFPHSLAICGLICLTARQLKSWLPKIAAKLASAFAEATRGGKTQLVARTQYTTQLHIGETQREREVEREVGGRQRDNETNQKVETFLGL